MIVAVGPHADDAEIGAGGLLSASGARVKPLIWLATSGDETRAQEAQDGASRLGASLVLPEEPGPDGSLAPTPALIDSLAAIVRAGDTLLVPPEDDTHQDHRAAYRIALSAARRLPVTILEYRTPSTPPGWAPDVFVALDDEAMATKVLACACHVSQAGHPYLFEHAVESLALSEGRLAGVSGPVEAYRLVRAFRAVGEVDLF